MDLDQTEIDRLIAQPSETRAVEIKAWIDPRVAEGKAKILTAALALRNFDGGRILIGFDNNSLQPLPMTTADLLGAYHNDDIQAIISKYASDPFDVVVGYGERNGTKYPIIAINGGIRTPVAVKIPLISANGLPMIKKGAVFFRTLLANGTVSSAEAQPGDWPEIMQICMDNREADIGRFIRRHLNGIDSTSISSAFASLTAASATFPSLAELANSWLDEGNRKAEAAISRWYELPHDNDPQVVRELAGTGAWEVGLIIDPQLTGRVADDQFTIPLLRMFPSIPDGRFGSELVAT